MSSKKIKRRVPDHITTPFDRCGDDAARHRAELIRHLETALKLEHATIPPYICALYSIKEGTNHEAAMHIRSVALEEMLHMTLVANLLTAVGGTPVVTDPDFILRHGDTLPGIAQSPRVDLARLSVNALDLFLRIESPGPIGDPIPEHGGYATIGQFYASIKDELDLYRHKMEQGKFKEPLFVGDPTLQVSPLDYYSGGGEVVEVVDFESARRAIKIIVDEGEGFDHSIFSGDHEQFGEQPDLAHYYKFKELRVGRRYLPSDSPRSNPTGPAVPIDFTERGVYQASIVTAKVYAELHESVLDDIRTFQRTYGQLLSTLEDGFGARSGDGTKSEHFRRATELMFDIRHLLTKFMKLEGTPIIPEFQLGQQSTDAP